MESLGLVIIIQSSLDKYFANKSYRENFSCLTLGCFLSWFAQFMNNPTSKYGTYKDELKFFNYHEYLVKDYKLIVSAHPETGIQTAVCQSPLQNSHSLVITTFPNVHVDRDSLMFSSSRIIRIPRIYHTPYPDLIPQFSTFFPGKEPAAIIQKDQIDFEPVGIYDGAPFGVSSLTPLTNLIQIKDLEIIITKVNDFLNSAYNPFGVNGLESTIDILTGGFYSQVFSTFTKKTLQRLETYLDEVNVKYDIQFISPSKTGFTSFDIQIPVNF